MQNQMMFPTQYAQRYSNPYPAPQTNSILWVQGIEGAKGYQTTPNSIVLLMDSENEGRFYIKSTDNIGMSNLRVFSYTEINLSQSPNVNNDLSEYVRKDELQSLITTIIKPSEVKDEQPVPTVKSSIGK